MSRERIPLFQDSRATLIPRGENLFQTHRENLLSKRPNIRKCSFRPLRISFLVRGYQSNLSAMSGNGDTLPTFYVVEDTKELGFSL